MYFAILIGGILLDRLSKLAVMHFMTLGEHIVVLPKLLDLCYITNKGAAFSMLEGRLWLLILITLAALVFLFWLWRYARHESEMFRIAVVLVASGAIGNLVDRIVYGEVVDFLQFGFWQSFPVFNVADILIVAAAALIIIDIFFVNKKNDGEKAE